MVPLFFSSETDNDFYPGYPHLATDCGVRSALKRETPLTNADFVSNISLPRATVGSMLRQHATETMSTGIITEQEIAWVAAKQSSFARHEEALAIRLGRLLDEGQINLGCRIPIRAVHHNQVLHDWIEPLGHKRHAAAGVA